MISVVLPGGGFYQELYHSAETNQFGRGMCSTKPFHSGSSAHHICEKGLEWCAVGKLRKEKLANVRGRRGSKCHHFVHAICICAFNVMPYTTMPLALKDCNCDLCTKDHCRSLTESMTPFREMLCCMCACHRGGEAGLWGHSDSK